ncbi:hypothetical protein Tco_0725426 [Tanacetum coccineum]|uniref:Uncharacterized protein n=1 Tax=Tanacetum coccineum TaxID=301880 RepID=A0ABQ4YDJ7_9ASTR
MSEQRLASQVDVNNNLSRPVTQHYLPKRRESVFAKPDHMIASSESRNSSKNMPRFSSNDMVHNHYLDEARKKTQERDRNSKTNVIPSARFQSTADGSKPKPRSTNHSTRSLPVSKSSCVTITAVPKADHSKSSSSFSDSKHFVCSTCHKCVFNANHDACITKLLKEVNSHAKIQSYKTRNSNKPVDQKSHTQKPGRQIFTRHRFSPNKTSVVYEKTSPRSDLRWKPTGRIFKSVGLRWIPTGKLFDSCTSKDDSEPTHGSNVDIPNIHESKQTLDLSAEVPSTDMIVMTSMIELESLFGPLFDEYFNGENQVVSKSSAVTTADASDKRQQQPDSTSSTSTLATTVTADGNFDLFNRRCCNHVPAKSDSLPHTHTQALKVNHSTSRLLILNFLKDLQTKVDQESQIKMIQVKEMMQDKDLKNSKSKDKGSRSRSQSMNEQSHYKQEKTKTRPKKAKLKRHIFNIKEDKKLRIEQYFQVQDYALWDVIENGNSFKQAAQTTINADGSSTTLIPCPVTTDEKTQKKNDVKFSIKFNQASLGLNPREWKLIQANSSNNKNADGTSTSLILGHGSLLKLLFKEECCKARSVSMMALPMKIIMNFISIWMLEFCLLLVKLDFSGLQMKIVSPLAILEKFNCLGIEAMDLRLVSVLVKIFSNGLGNPPDALWLRSWCHVDKLEK